MQNNILNVKLNQNKKIKYKVHVHKTASNGHYIPVDYILSHMHSSIFVLENMGYYTFNGREPYSWAIMNLRQN